MLVCDYQFREKDYDSIISSPKKYAKDAIISHFKNKFGDGYELLFNDSEDIKIITSTLYSLESFMEFFKTHKVRKNNIIKIRTLNLSSIDIADIFSKYDEEDFTNQLFINVDNGRETISYDKFMKMVNPLNEIQKNCESNLSPLEKIILIYDKVKKNVYKNAEDKHSLESRLLSEVLTNPEHYIVCVGFVKIFNEMLRINNIKCCEYNFQMKENNQLVGHSISLVNIDDDKYNIHGLYFFDITRDSFVLNNDKNAFKYSGFLLSFEDLIKKYDIVRDDFDKYFFKTDSELDFMIKLKKLHASLYTDKEFVDPMSDVNNDKFEFLSRFMALDNELFDGVTKLGACENIFYQEIMLYNYIKYLKECMGPTILSEDIEFINLINNTNIDNKSQTDILSCLISRGVDDHMDATNKVLKITQKENQ